MKHTLPPLLALLAALLALPLSAASPGAIEGHVVDGSGKAIAGAVVTLRSAVVSTSFTTSLDGSYRFDALPPGAYVVEASSKQNGTVAQEEVDVDASRTTVVDVTLDREPDESVTMTRETALLDPRSFDSNGVFSSPELDSSPSTRRLADFATRLPGVYSLSGLEGPIAARGSSPALAAFDGHPLSDGADRIVPLLDSGSFDQLRVVVSPLDPAGDAAPTLDLVARRGGDAFAGSVEALYAWRVSSDAPALRHEGELRGDAGGPLVHDHLWGWIGAASRRTSTGQSLSPEQRLLDVTASSDAAFSSATRLRVVAMHAALDETAGDESLTLFGADLTHLFSPRLTSTTSASLRDRASSGLPDGRLSAFAERLTFYAGGPAEQVIDAGADYRRDARPGPAYLAFERLGGYVGDSFRHGRWSGELAARFDRQVADDGGDTTSHDSVSPRLGLAWLAGNTSLTLLRVTAAQYREDLAQNAAAPRIDEFRAGFEHQLLPEMTAGGEGVWRRFEEEGILREAGFYLRKRLSNGFVARLYGSWRDIDSLPPARSAGSRWACGGSGFIELTSGWVAAAGLSLHGPAQFPLGDASLRTGQGYRLDLRASKAIRIADRPLRLALDLLNATDQEPSVETEGAVAGDWPATATPRLLRVGLRYSF